MAVRAAVVALVAVGLFMGSIGHASADSRHSCFTTDGDPDVVAALAKWSMVAAVSDCGYSNKPDIVVAPLTEFRRDWLQANFAAAVTWRTGPPEGITGCEIWHAPEIGHDEWYWLHELGHCLGLEHSAEPFAVMNPAQSIDSKPHIPQPDDVSALISIYGPRIEPLRYRAVVSVGRE